MCPKVMVVDDEPDNIELVQMILEAEGIEVEGASSGFECLDKLDKVDPDLILLDIMMPEMDGWETFHQIRKKNKDVKIAMLTVKDQEFDKMLGLHVLKADDYITKPFGVKQLVRRVKALLDME
ncbi:response regulator receiver protein [Methanosalsum zhilinae DSM 4017]|uniref:Response regulator receiver protein n=1 Tax=Methanosalsum zhilinae (strain DSM 4017 / NBRC 107636 / OCM 62 / WeN5) TaxID=679901 RepID=F7XPY3_METZD|nr:response regulator [Methanosalsum zhilinae]AEH61505.1 response regulator receiver protein [Methanosalsum zhilinae DSM 4017]